MRIKNKKSLSFNNPKLFSVHCSLFSINSSLFIAICSLFIVICSLFFVSCPTPSTSSLLEQELPQGYGSFSLRLEENTGRAIFPSAPVLSAYAVYELRFTNTNDSSLITADRTNVTLAANPVILPVGEYTLVVYAFLDTAKTQRAAEGTPAGPIIITAGINETATVQLHALFDYGEGTFGWNVNITASGLTSATMTIMQGATPLSGYPMDLSLTGQSSGTPLLPSGIYNVNFHLKRQNEETEWNELLYIYSALTSDFSIEFENDVFHRTHYNVTIVFNDGSTPNGLQSVLHAGTLTRPSNPARTGFNFINWYSDAALTTLHNFDAIVINDITIYVRWGIGTPQNPFQIFNEADLRRVGTWQDTQDGIWSLSAHYILMADIELDAGNPNNWTPIGSSANRFSGNFNGNNYRIINLSINNTALSNAGLFGAFSTGTGTEVRRLGLENVNINAGSNVGGITGTMENGLINNCYVTGIIKGTGHVGGIAGVSSWNGRVTNCYVLASIESPATTRVGGIVGSCWVQPAGGHFANNAVLSQRILGSHRIGGRSEQGALGGNNVAFAYMLNRAGNTSWGRKGLTDIGGADIFAWEIYADPRMGNRFTAANGWFVETGKLPGFRGAGVDWPSWLIDVPVITLNFTLVNGAPPIADVTLYRTDQSLPNRPGTATFTIDNPGDFQFIEWWMNNTNLTEFDPSELTIDALDYSAGNRDLTLEVITNSGVPFSRVITVRIML